MATRSSKLRRVLLIVVVLLGLGFLGTLAELVRRDQDRQQIIALREALTGWRSRNIDPGRFEKRWPRLHRRLQEEIQADPTGPLALLAHRTTSKVWASVPSSASGSTPLMVQMHFGDTGRQDRLVPGQPFLWSAEVVASWDGGPRVPVYETTWTHERTASGEVDVLDVLQEPDLSEGVHTLELRALCTLWLGTAASEAGDVPPVDAQYAVRESVNLGQHKVIVGAPRPTASGRL